MSRIKDLGCAPASSGGSNAEVSQKSLVLSLKRLGVDDTRVHYMDIKSRLASPSWTNSGVSSNRLIHVSQTTLTLNDLAAEVKRPVVRGCVVSPLSPMVATPSGGGSIVPGLNMVKAMRLAFLHIICFYVISVFLLGMVDPHNSADLAFVTIARGGTAVLSIAAVRDILFAGAIDESQASPSLGTKDMLGQSLPIPHQLELGAEVMQLVKYHDATLPLGNSLTRGGGYYPDTGCSQLITEGKVKIESSPQSIKSLYAGGLILGDGCRLVIVLVTGYDIVRTTVRKIIGDTIADIWDLDDEGELNAVHMAAEWTGRLLVYGGKLGAIPAILENTSFADQDCRLNIQYYTAKAIVGDKFTHA
ncbi:putative flavin-containing monooxygenase YUCCA3 [Seiridium cardinale]